jgi:1-acyl-sn-glycerol-3-phosphate acyltransferase
MSLLYRMSRQAGRFIFFCTMRSEVINSEVSQRSGGYVLALTHLGNVDPFCSCVINRRPIDWMTRKEFFRMRIVAWLLEAHNCFQVDRHGIPVSSIRAAISRVQRGRTVGVCPEGGVTVGAAAAIRGGMIKKGCCSIALRAGAPIIPCVMLGTDKLNCIGPWLPFRRAKIWVMYGEPIHPAPGAKSTRAARAELSERVGSAFCHLYGQLRQRYGICDSTVP